MPLPTLADQKHELNARKAAVLDWLEKEADQVHWGAGARGRYCEISARGRAVVGCTLFDAGEAALQAIDAAQAARSEQ